VGSLLSRFSLILANLLLKLYKSNIGVGGMTAKKYIGISKTSKATATRDLQLHVMGIFVQEGAGRSI
jgi:Fic family protein